MKTQGSCGQDMTDGGCKDGQNDSDNTPSSVYLSEADLTFLISPTKPNGHNPLVRSDVNFASTANHQNIIGSSPSFSPGPAQQIIFISDGKSLDEKLYTDDNISVHVTEGCKEPTGLSSCMTVPDPKLCGFQESSPLQSIIHFSSSLPSPFKVNVKSCGSAVTDNIHPDTESMINASGVQNLTGEFTDKIMKGEQNNAKQAFVYTKSVNPPAVFCSCSNDQPREEVPVEQVFEQHGKLFRLPQAYLLKVDSMEFYVFDYQGTLYAPLAMIYIHLGSELSKVLEAEVFQSRNYVFKNMDSNEFELLKQNCNLNNSNVSKTIISLDSLKEMSKKILQKYSSPVLRSLADGTYLIKVLGSHMRCSNCGYDISKPDTAETFLDIEELNDVGSMSASHETGSGLTGKLDINGMKMAAVELDKKVYVCIREIVRLQMFTLNILQEKLSLLQCRPVVLPRELEKMVKSLTVPVQNCLWIDIETFRCVCCMAMNKQKRVRRRQELMNNISMGKYAFHPEFLVTYEIKEDSDVQVTYVVDYSTLNVVSKITLTEGSYMKAFQVESQCSEEPKKSLVSDVLSQDGHVSSTTVGAEEGQSGKIAKGNNDECPVVLSEGEYIVPDFDKFLELLRSGHVKMVSGSDCFLLPNEKVEEKASTLSNLHKSPEANSLMNVPIDEHLSEVSAESQIATDSNSEILAVSNSDSIESTKKELIESEIYNMCEILESECTEYASKLYTLKDIHRKGSKEQALENLNELEHKCVAGHSDKPKCTSATTNKTLPIKQNLEQVKSLESLANPGKKNNAAPENEKAISCTDDSDGKDEYSAESVIQNGAEGLVGDLLTKTCESKESVPLVVDTCHEHKDQISIKPKDVLTEYDNVTKTPSNLGNRNSTCTNEIFVSGAETSDVSDDNLSEDELHKGAGGIIDDLVTKSGESKGPLHSPLGSKNTHPLGADEHKVQIHVSAKPNDILKVCNNVTKTPSNFGDRNSTCTNEMVNLGIEDSDVKDECSAEGEVHKGAGDVVDDFVTKSEESKEPVPSVINSKNTCQIGADEHKVQKPNDTLTEYDNVTKTPSSLGDSSSTYTMESSSYKEMRDTGGMSEVPKAPDLDLIRKYVVLTVEKDEAGRETIKAKRFKSGAAAIFPELWGHPKSLEKRASFLNAVSTVMNETFSKTDQKKEKTRNDGKIKNVGLDESQCKVTDRVIDNVHQSICDKEFSANVDNTSSLVKGRGRKRKAVEITKIAKKTKQDIDQRCKGIKPCCVVLKRIQMLDDAVKGMQH